MKVTLDYDSCNYHNHHNNHRHHCHHDQRAKISFFPSIRWSCSLGSSRKSEHIKIELWRVGYDGWIPRECWEGHLHLSISCLHTRTLPWVMKKSYGKAKFQVDQISNFMSFLDSSQKTDNWKYHSFLKIPSGTLSKMRAKFAAIVVFILRQLPPERKIRGDTGG